MNSINIVCDIGFLMIDLVECFFFGDSTITIHQKGGGIISLKRSSITSFSYNGKELINGNK